MKLNLYHQPKLCQNGSESDLGGTVGHLLICTVLFCMWFKWLMTKTTAAVVWPSLDIAQSAHNHRRLCRIQIRQWLWCTCHFSRNTALCSGLTYKPDADVHAALALSQAVCLEPSRCKMYGLVTCDTENNIYHHGNSYGESQDG